MHIHKPRVLVIETGGTIAQVRGRDGIWRAGNDPVTPKIKGLGRIADVKVERLATLIDSTNMLTDQRAKLARMVYEKRTEFDGFVIIHGTDTMADSAAALTFMLQGLGKPIVLTGSQLPLVNPRSDGSANVHAAVKAATMDYGEVVIAFGNHILRGPRAIKFDEEGFNAFGSPRTPPVGKVGIVIEPSEHRIPRSQHETRIFTDFDTSIGFFYPMSGTSVDMFISQVRQTEVHGFVLVGFGAGNIPDVYYGAISEATQLHKPIIVVTQCLQGAADMGIYEVGAVPLKLGAIPGGDMTMQTATQKLMYALGRAKFENIPPEKLVEFVRGIIHTSYAKEIDVTGNRV